jgi:hypothetical protein
MRLLVPWAAAQNVAEFEDGELHTDQHAERLPRLYRVAGLSAISRPDPHTRVAERLLMTNEGTTSASARGRLRGFPVPEAPRPGPMFGVDMATPTPAAAIAPPDVA